MHSKIIQLSSEPIEEEDYLTESDCYEDLDKIEPFGADYVADISEDEVDEVVFGILEDYSDILDVDREKRTVRLKENPDWSAYKKALEDFRKNVSELTLEEFLKDSFCRRFKIWKFTKTVSNTETCFLVDGSYLCENRFVEHLLFDKERKPLYIGGALDYHW